MGLFSNKVATVFSCEFCVILRTVFYRTPPVVDFYHKIYHLSEYVKIQV